MCSINREAVVEELATLGARIHTCARDEAQLQESLRKWQAKGFQVTTSVCDVSSRDKREKLMETVSTIFEGKLNILVSTYLSFDPYRKRLCCVFLSFRFGSIFKVNNVGTCIVKPTLQHTAEDFSFTMATNLESAFHLSQLAHPLLKASGSGSIVLISSVSGVVHVNGASIYGVSKGKSIRMYIQTINDASRSDFYEM